MTFSDKFRCYVDLREEVMRKMGIPKSNFISLVDELVLHPAIDLKQVKFGQGLMDFTVFVNQGSMIDLRMNERILGFCNFLSLRSILLIGLQTKSDINGKDLDETQ